MDEITPDLYVDATGNFLGYFYNGAKPDDNKAVKISIAPEHGKQIWNKTTKSWGSFVEELPITADQLALQLKTKGLITAQDILNAGTIGK